MTHSLADRGEESREDDVKITRCSQDTVYRQEAINALQLLMTTWFTDSNDEQREVED